MSTLSNLPRLWFSGVLVFFAFALVAFDNGRFINLLYLSSVLLTGSYLVFAVLTFSLPRVPLAMLAYVALAAFGFASVLWSTDPEFSADRAKTLVLIAITIFATYNIILRFRNPLAFFLGLYGGVLLNLLMALGIVDFGDLGLGLELTTSARFTGTQNQPNIMGYVCVATLFAIYVHLTSVSARQAKAVFRLLEIFGLLAVAAAAMFITFLTGSRAAIVAGSVVLLWLLLGSVVRPVLALAIAIVLSGTVMGYSVVGSQAITLGNELSLAEVGEVVFGRLETGIEFEDGSVIEREALVKDAYRQFLKQPVIGTGLASFEAKTGAYSHNNVTDVLSSLGIIGMTFMAAIYFFYVRSLLKLTSFRLALSFGLFLAIQLLFDMALVTFSHKFQMLMVFVMLACVAVLTETRSQSLVYNQRDHHDPYAGARRSRRKRRRRRQ